MVNLPSFLKATGRAGRLPRRVNAAPFWSPCCPALCSTPSVCLQLAHLTNLVVPSFSPSSPAPLPFPTPDLSPPLPSLLVLAGPSAAACSVFSKLLPPSPLASLSTPAVQLGINPVSSSALSLLCSCGVFVLRELLLIRYGADTAPSGFGVHVLCAAVGSRHWDA